MCPCVLPRRKIRAVFKKQLDVFSKMEVAIIRVFFRSIVFQKKNEN